MRNFESGGNWARPEPKAAVNPIISFRLLALEAELNAAFDALQAETTALFRSLAKSTGQRTRADRVKK